jgi:hypothetical protein
MFVQLDRSAAFASRLAPTWIGDRDQHVGASLLAKAAWHSRKNIRATNKNARRDAWHFM